MRTDYIVDRYANLQFKKIENENDLQIGMIVQVIIEKKDSYPSWEYIEITKENFKELKDLYLDECWSSTNLKFIEDTIRIPVFGNEKIIVNNGDILNDFIPKNEYDFYNRFVRKSGYYLIKFGGWEYAKVYYIWVHTNDDPKIKPEYSFAKSNNDKQMPFTWLETSRGCL